MKLIVCLLCAFLSLFSTLSAALADDLENDLYAEDVYMDGWEQEETSQDPRVMFVCAQPYVRLRRTDSTDLPYVDKMPYGSMVTEISTQINDVGGRMEPCLLQRPIRILYDKIPDDRDGSVRQRYASTDDG